MRIIIAQRIYKTTKPTGRKTNHFRIGFEGGDL
jgi:hypothetical protein